MSGGRTLGGKGAGGGVKRIPVTLYIQTHQGLRSETRQTHPAVILVAREEMERQDEVKGPF